jgi:hypothetical protein
VWRGAVFVIQWVCAHLRPKPLAAWGGFGGVKRTHHCCMAKSSAFKKKNPISLCTSLESKQGIGLICLERNLAPEAQPLPVQSSSVSTSRNLLIPRVIFSALAFVMYSKGSP